jgi:hypothetical protein
MAENDEDLVSQIKVEGGEEGAAQIEQFADRGAAAFDKLGDASKKSAAESAAATKRIGDEAKNTQSIFNEFKNIKLGPGVLKDINRIKTGLADFGQSLGRTTQAVGRFAGRLALIGTAAQGAAVALVLGAEKIAKAVDGQNTALKDQTKSQTDARNVSLSLETAQINLASSQRGLLKDAREGKITWTEYTKAIKTSNEDFREQQRVAAQVAEATRRATEDNERFQASLAKREALNKLIDTFGGPLTQSLVSFGRQVETTRRGFLEGFGPGVAKLVDTIGKAFSDNAPKISAFFDTMGAKLSAFVSQNGPAIQLALENIGAAGAAIFEGLLAAGPPLLDFFNNQLVPAIRGIGEFFSSVAETINATFGTKLTGGFLVLILLMAQVSGALRLMFAVVRTGIPLFRALFGLVSLLTGGFTPFGIALKIVIGLLVLLATQVDWNAFGLRVTAALAAITTALNNIRTNGAAAIQAIIDKFNEFVAFVAGLPGQIGETIASIWQGVVDTAKAAWDQVTSFVQGFVDFVTSLPEQLGAVFTAIGQAMIDAFNNAIQRTLQFFRDLAAQALAILQPILDLINAITGGTPGLAAGGQPPGFARGGSPDLIRGPGTSTSDSILARLSNNEFVMRAKAVGKYGVDFMRAVNEGRFKMPKFNMGGLNVIGPPISRPSFADGGPVNGGSSLRPLSLTILGETFKGLMAPEDTADRMVQFAIAKNARRAGRSPGWVGGK